MHTLIHRLHELLDIEVDHLLHIAIELGHVAHFVAHLLHR